MYPKRVIRAENLKKSFTTDAGEIHVLRGIDLMIGEGEMVGIVGAFGRGKEHTSPYTGSVGQTDFG